jgi:hypothetical protein
MSDTRYTIHSIIVCDDVRHESNGKAFLIGVYTGDIIVPAFPVNFLKIIVFLNLTAHTKLDAFHFYVQGENGTKYIEVEDAVPKTDAREQNVLVFDVRGVKLEKPQELKVFMGIDEVPKQLYSFSIRQPENETERKIAQSTR